MAKRRSNKPYVMTINEDGKRVDVDYSTYRELVKDMKNTLNKFLDNRHKDWDLYSVNGIGRENHVTVIRSRRGEWGEWFEHWELKDLKAVKIKQGWM